ncbi:hypothetical protein DSM100685_1486, partial [Bifidobacterium avesanii]
MLFNKALHAAPAHNLAFKQAPVFFVAYTIWLSVALLNTSNFSVYFGHNNILYYFSVFLFIISEIIFINDLSLLDVIVAFVLIIFNLQTYFWGHEDLLAFSILLFCGRKILFADIAKCTIFVQTFVSIFIIISSFCGLIPSTTNIRANGVIRYSLGFSYVTYPSYVFLNVVLLWLYLRKSLISYIELGIFAILNSALLVVTNARNGCGLIYIVLFSALLLKVFPSFNFPDIIKKFFISCFVLFASIFFLLVILFSKFSENSVLI